MVGIADVVTLGGKPLIEEMDVFGDRAAAEQQQAAAEQALAAQIAEAERAREYARERSDLGIALAEGLTREGVTSLRETGGAAQRVLGEGLTGAEGALAGGEQRALAGLRGGYGQARGDLGVLQGLQGYAPGATRAVDVYDVTGRESELGRLMREGIEGDAGYQFRLQQGEEALARQAAARGGRMSGRAQKELAQFGQGLASQEFGAAAQRAAQVDAMRQQALLNQAGRADVAALQAQQNQALLAQMGYGAQGQLAGMAAQRGQLESGLTAGMAGQVAGLRAGTAEQRARAYQQTGAGVGGLMGQLGTTAANAAIGAGTQGTAISQSLMGLYGGPVATAGAATQAAGNTQKEMAGLLAGIFASDERIKCDIDDGDADVAEMLDTLRPYVFRYLNPEHGEGRRLGIMAQDAEQTATGSIMVREQDGVKMIDGSAALSAVLAAVGFLNAELKQERVRVEALTARIARLEGVY